MERAWLGLCHRDILSRMALAFAAAVAVCLDHSGVGSAASLAHRHGATRYCDLARRFPARRPEATLRAQAEARDETEAVFIQDIKPLEQLRADAADDDRRSHQGGYAD